MSTRSQKIGVFIAVVDSKLAGGLVIVPDGKIVGLVLHEDFKASDVQNLPWEFQKAFEQKKESTSNINTKDVIDLTLNEMVNAFSRGTGQTYKKVDHSGLPKMEGSITVNNCWLN